MRSSRRAQTTSLSSLARIWDGLIWGKLVAFFQYSERMLFPPNGLFLVLRNALQVADSFQSLVVTSG